MVQAVCKCLVVVVALALFGCAGSFDTLGGLTSSNGCSAVPQFVASHIFYNDSILDGRHRGNEEANEEDDNAIDDTKKPLWPGQTAIFANYTSYYRGINGIMVDIESLPGGAESALSLEDFALTVGNNSRVTRWAAAPAPTSMTVRAISDCVSRVTLIWHDDTRDLIENKWLNVRVKANQTTGLSSEVSFYWGNAIGDSGDSSENTLVTDADRPVHAVERYNRDGSENPLYDARFDYGRVNVTDNTSNAIVDCMMAIQDDSDSTACIDSYVSDHTSTSLNLITVPEERVSVEVK